MNHPEDRAGDVHWTAWEHRDHSDRVHVSVVAGLDRDDLRDLREQADGVCSARERCLTR